MVIIVYKRDKFNCGNCVGLKYIERKENFILL